MTCWEILPPDFDPAKKYPALLYCQGRSAAGGKPVLEQPLELHDHGANGYIVIAPNRHGVPGFGAEWNRQISGDYGGQKHAGLLCGKPIISKDSPTSTQTMSAQ